VCVSYRVIFFQAILKQSNAFGPYDIPTIVAKLQNYHISIGVKKLLDLLDMVKQMGEQNRCQSYKTFFFFVTDAPLLPSILAWSQISSSTQ